MGHIKFIVFLPMCGQECDRPVWKFKSLENMSWCSFWEQDDLKVIVIVLERKISSKFHFRLHGFVVHSVMSSSSWPHGLQHTRLPWPSLSSRVFSNSCPLSPWCHPTTSSSITLFCSCLQSFPASGSFSMSWLYVSSGHSIGASASVLPINGQDWFPLGLTGWISLQSKGLSRVFSNTTVQKHPFFNAQLSL